jgi:hypothetical protein
MSKLENYHQEFNWQIDQLGQKIENKHMNAEQLRQ